ncbi:MAG TPA: hypothetical protein VGR00_11980, partial [Thermoanaerobaculia bacterium]|nr:hypothetical protein [Thermoanaerobaculia bacterium]
MNTGWTLRPEDIATGALELLRVQHPLLPETMCALPAPDGLRLTPAPAVPSPLRTDLAEGARVAFLVRLLGLAAFLKTRGLGLAARDLGTLGGDASSADRPALGAPPVPSWRAVSPALATGALAARLAGASLESKTSGDLAREIAAIVDRGHARGSLKEVVACLEADASGRAPEALLADLARSAPLPPLLGADLLGLVFPDVSSRDLGRERPASAGGEAALFFARGAVRGEDGERFFVEVGPGQRREPGGVLRRLARSLSDHPLAATIHRLAGGPGAETVPAEGPPLALLAIDVDRWDAPSRCAYDEAFGG